MLSYTYPVRVVAYGTAKSWISINVTTRPQLRMRKMKPYKL